MTDSWAQVPALVDGLRHPTELQRLLKEQVQQAYMTLSRQRGPVHVPEDTWDMLRRIGSAYDLFKGYQAAFGDVVKLLRQLAEEELVEAVGEQDGIPNQGMTVPDAEGDIRLSRDEPKTYEIDVDQLVAVLVSTLETEHALVFPGGGVTDAEPVELIVKQTIEAVLSWGKFEPQVSKVRAYAATLARNGDDQGSSIVSGAITVQNPYKGVKFERTKS